MLNSVLSFPTTLRHFKFIFSFSPHSPYSLFVEKFMLVNSRLLNKHIYFLTKAILKEIIRNLDKNIVQNDFYNHLLSTIKQSILSFSATKTTCSLNYRKY